MGFEKGENEEALAWWLGILMMRFNEIYSKFNAGSVIASGDRWGMPKHPMAWKQEGSIKPERRGQSAGTEQQEWPQDLAYHYHEVGLMSEQPEA